MFFFVFPRLVVYTGLTSPLMLLRTRLGRGGKRGPRRAEDALEETPRRVAILYPAP